MEYMSGVIKEDMRGIGQQTRCMVGEHINGLKEEHTKVSIKTIVNMAMVAIRGQMEENTSENGKIIKDMEKVN